VQGIKRGLLFSSFSFLFLFSFVMASAVWRLGSVGVIPLGASWFGLLGGLKMGNGWTTDMFTGYGLREYDGMHDGGAEF